MCFLGACFYSDGEVYTAVPVAGDPPLVSVSSNLDTLLNPLVGDSLRVEYEVSIEQGVLYYVEASVSGSVVHSSDISYGLFWLYPSQSEGIDSLYLDLYHNTNSNTLADATGYEASVTRVAYAIDFNGGTAR